MRKTVPSSNMPPPAVAPRSEPPVPGMRELRGLAPSEPLNSWSVVSVHGSPAVDGGDSSKTVPHPEEPQLAKINRNDLTRGCAFDGRVG